MLNIVILNGGRGAAAIIPALIKRPGVTVTSVVNAYDDGKSTGEIRRFFGMLGPSDIRKVQELMLPTNDPDYQANLQVFSYRFSLDCKHDDVISQLHDFTEDRRLDLIGIELVNIKVRTALQSFIKEFLESLSTSEKINNEQFNFSDCSIMNCIYAGAFLVFNRNIERATLFINKLFKLQGTVLPTSIEDKKLVALRENGQMLYNEAEIVELRSNVRVERIYLLDKLLDRSRFEILDTTEKRHYLDRNHCYVEVSPHVKLALQQADVIIYAAGTQHSSLYPTYLSTGLAQNIADNKLAYKVFITNIGADYETPNYKASDYILGAYRYLNLSDTRNYAMNELFDTVLVNKSFLKADETYVKFDEDAFEDIPVNRVIGKFECSTGSGKHDGDIVVEAILDLYEKSSALVV